MTINLPHSHPQPPIPQVEASVLATQLRPCLEELATDGDRDVRYYASRAIKLCDELAPRH